MAPICPVYPYDLVAVRSARTHARGRVSKSWAVVIRSGRVYPTRRRPSSGRRRCRRRNLADRADRECVRICGLAFRFGLRPLAARLPDRDALQFAGRHRSLDPARVASERHAEGTQRCRAPAASRRSRQSAIWPEEAAFAGFYRRRAMAPLRRNTTYLPTESGRAIVDAYLQHRRDTLVRLVGSMSGRRRRCNRRPRFCM